jgi:predicted PhzF superfamily epimerase YddE/YHI9
VPLILRVVDAFTDAPFSGNPAAVTVVDGFPADDRMQAIAREMNLSETAFVVRRDDGEYDLRWFTPVVEVDLCGHATLAAAHVLGGVAAFHTRSGRLACSESDDGWIDMVIPPDPPVTAEPPPLASSAEWRWYGRGRSDVLIELGKAAQVRSYQPDLGALAALRSRAVVITAAGDREGIDCVSRVFAPNVGVPEDPVTGSVHTALAAFWAKRLGKDQLVGEQASPRGGIVRMRVADDYVVVSGKAVTVSEVTLLV